MSKEKAQSFINSLVARDILEFDGDYEEDELYQVNQEYSLTCDCLDIWAIQLTEDKIIFIDENGADCFYPYAEFKKEEFSCKQTISL